MESPQSFIPSIRFEGFSNPWEQRKVADIASDTRGGGTPSTSNPAYWNGEIPWIQSSDLSDGKLFGVKPRKRISRAGLNSSATQLVPENSIAVVTRVGVGKLAFMPYSFTTSQDFLSLCRMQTEPYFTVYSLYQMLQGELQAVQGTSIKGMTKDDLLSKFVFVPRSKDEQQQIGLLFSRLDTLITLHQRKYDCLKNVKKSMLEKMFPRDGNNVPEIRFDGFTNPWEQRKWSETVDISTDMVDPRTGQYDELPHVAPGNIESFTGRLYDNVKLVKDENLISGKFRFYAGDIIYGKINPQLGKYVFATFPGLTSADAYVLNAKNGINQKFLFAILQTQDFYDYSVSVSKRSGMPKINRDELNAYYFMSPSADEQAQIGQLLLDLDALITLHQRKYEKLKQIKKSLLQKMFV